MAGPPRARPAITDPGIRLADPRPTPTRAHYTPGGAALYALLAELEAGSPLAGRLPLSAGRLGVLRVLARAGPRTASQLARVRGASRQSIQRLVDALVADGLVRARENPRHRRSPLLEVTEAGADAIRSCTLAEAAFANRWAASLDAHDIRAATRLLKRLRRSAG